jgi:hypothetical protein
MKIGLLREDKQRERETQEIKVGSLWYRLRDSLTLHCARLNHNSQRNFHGNISVWMCMCERMQCMT